MATGLRIMWPEIQTWRDTCVEAVVSRNENSREEIWQKWTLILKSRKGEKWSTQIHNEMEKTRSFTRARGEKKISIRQLISFNTTDSKYWASSNSDACFYVAFQLFLPPKSHKICMSFIAWIFYNSLNVWFINIIPFFLDYFSPSLKKNEPDTTYLSVTAKLILSSI